MIKYSEQESDLLGLKIGRVELNHLDDTAFFKEIIKEEYDLIRLKVDSKHFNINHQIEKLGIPAYYCGSILKYEMYFFNLPSPSFYIKNAEFSFYTSDQKQILYDLICDSFRADPLGYYKNPLISQFLTKEEEVHSMASFYVNQVEQEKNKMFFLKLDGNFAGFISIFEVEKGVVDTPISGVAQAYRGNHVFDDLRSYRHLYCLENNIPLGLAGARSENFYSQKTFVNDGMIHVGNESIYQITPLLSKQTDGCLEVQFSIQSKNLQGALAEFQAKIIAEHKGFISSDEFYLVAGRTCIVHPFYQSPQYYLKINTTIKSSNKMLTVSKVYDEHQEIQLVVYSQFQRFDK